MMSLEEGYYKIGISKNPKKRLKQLQTGSSSDLQLIDTYKTSRYSIIEKSLHRIYSHGLKRGEWFDLNIEEVNNFKNNCKIFEKNIELIEQNNDFF